MKLLSRLNRLNRLKPIMLGILAAVSGLTLAPCVQAGQSADTEMCRRLLGQLTGEAPVSEGRFLRDRSLHQGNEDRELLRDFLMSELRRRGLDPELQTFSLGSPAQAEEGLNSIFSGLWRSWKENKKPAPFNIVVNIPGKGSPSKRNKIIIGAHFDVVNERNSDWKGSRLSLRSRKSPLLATPGADDNGSGVVGVFALIDRFRAKPIESDLEFVFFDAEEPTVWGSQLGSRAYVRSLPERERFKISQVLIFDMIGVPPQTLKQSYNLSAMGIGFKRLRWIENVVQGTHPIQPEIQPGFQPYIQTWDDPYFVGHLSDSRTFTGAGLKTLLFCDVMGTRALPDHYHTERDSSAVIDWNYLMGIVDHAELMIRHLFDHDSWNEKGEHQYESP